ncbi:MG2 domain-containing protein [Cerasicoccus fimbriatus]|uniref:alpha-2-macroglobulin family protein n=1 Tax=Cerasicoccus fimbriatus TaxID=3014554 RepID=UPI0022B41CEE|nr:MG2 domain-containing protein [Cerasicoccus sp. TK19100]
MSPIPFCRLFCAALLLMANWLHAADTVEDASALLQQADQAYTDHSYHRAAQLYERLAQQETLPAGIDRDQLTYRLADSQWRNLAATNQSDRQVFDDSREALSELAAKLQKDAKGARAPQLWADVQESLGDSYWLPQQVRNWSQAWQHYQQALSWWAASTDIDLARERYLAIVFKAAKPPSQQPYQWRYGYQYGNWMPVNVLQNATSIAQSPADKSHANYLLATSYARQNNADTLKAQPAFEAAITDPKSEWADDALFNYAQWAQRSGGSYWDENGRFRRAGDDALALKLYREYVNRYRKGEAPNWDAAQNQIENITNKDLNVFVHTNFLPGSANEFFINWRNIDQVEIHIYAVDLPETYQPKEDNSNASPYAFDEYDVSGLTPTLRLTRQTEGKPYARQSDSIKLDKSLPAGAYVIQAQGDGLTSQALLLVSNQVVTVLRDGNSVLAWVTDAQSGKPIADASVKLWLGDYQWQNHTTNMGWVSTTATTDDDGIARFNQESFQNLGKDFADYESAIVITESKDQISIATSNNDVSHYGIMGGPTNANLWKVYAFTDRPAYRPGDTINWKATARVRSTQSNWRTPPTGQALQYKVTGPQGETVAEGTMNPNDYGSIWGEFTAQADWKLGMYHVVFSLPDEENGYIGGDAFFRLEEYKLPEFKVSVSTASEDGQANTAYRLGDEVKVEIKADYYFGGAVANAEVRVVVEESPYYHYWLPPTPYPWLRTMPQRYHSGKTVINERLKTDAEGRAVLNLPTKANSSNDLVYKITAHVVDESRREVSGSAEIRATRAPYFIYVQPERMLYQPGEKATVTIKALNANDDPVEVEGRVRLTREEWMQVWRGPDGEEISGEEYRRRLEKGPGLFSSALDPSEWTMIREGYDIEELKVTTLTTNREGEATFTFPVEKTGYYRVYWVSKPERSAPIKADAAIWAADSASQSIGYHGQLNIVTDEAAFREGKRAPVMISTQDTGRWVLFSVQGMELMDARVIYLEGNVKLLELDVSEAWIPNVKLQANQISNLRFHEDSQPISIPPSKHFLDVSVVTNAETYRPGEKATTIITTRNADGRPVQAEVALSVFDEAVLAIQPTLAPDPREFFYGQERPILVNTTSSFWQRGLADIKKPEDVAEYKDSAFDEIQTPGAAMGAFAAPAAMESDLAMRESNLVAKSAPMMSGAAGGAAADEPQVVVRTDFRSTVFWKPAIQTDASGQATVDFTWPDNLTSWNIEARATGLPASFGEGDTSAKTRLPLIARLQTPRFLVTGDQVTITGVINNNTSDAMSVQAELAIEGGATLVNSATQSIEAPANGSAQVNWVVDVASPGNTKFTLTAKSTSHGDAMELTVPIYEHGINKFLAQSGKMTTDNLELTLDIPEFKAEGASFTLHLTPSIATTMLDALPYLAQYPYGCTEQTMSRFLPAVIVAKTLNDLGLSASDVMQQNFGGIETDTPDKIVQQSKPKQDGNLVDLDKMVAAGLTRLTDFQNTDGGWGWWKGGDSDAYMSAYVVWGLTLAQQAGREIDAEMLKRGRDYLNLRLVDFENQYDMQAWLLHALASANRGISDAKPARNEARAFANLWKNRDQMVSFTRALTAISAKHLGFNDEADILADNLANGVKLDNDPQGSVLLGGNAPQSDPTALPTAHWGEDGVYYRWSRGGVESTAFVLAALTEIKPDSELIEPTMNWLVKNRRGAQWSNTRDTAIVVLALNQWLNTSGELNATGQYTAMLNGEAIGEINVSPDNVLTAPRSIEVPVEKLKAGEANKLTLQRKAGDSPLYFATRFNFFTLEDPIKAAGSEIFVRREYKRTYPVKTLLDGYATNSSLLASGEAATTGDRIEAIITIEAKNNLEYILIEDLKPAGFEAVALQSGAALYAKELRPGKLDQADRYTGRQQWVYQELRDRQIASFVSSLPQGLWEIRYELRAETPGKFSALPVIAEAMYVPEIKGNSAEFKVTVDDK